MPKPAQGWKVEAFARNLEHPRSLLVLPNGDVLVAETNAPDRPRRQQGPQGQGHEGAEEEGGRGHAEREPHHAAARPRPRRRAETKSAFAEKLSSPYGMALVGDKFYVANTDALVRFPYKAGETKVSGEPEKVAELPAGTINHHWTKSLAASKDGRASTSAWARTATSPSTVWRRKRIAPRARGRREIRRHEGLCERDAQSDEPDDRPGRQTLLGGGERARRARRRPRAGLPHVRARGVVLRLAVQLLRPERRRAQEATEPESSRRP
jgi:hypothetical protein